MLSPDNTTIIIIDPGVYKIDFYISFEPTTSPICFFIGGVGSTNTAGNIVLRPNPNGGEISVSRIVSPAAGATFQIINASDTDIILPSIVTNGIPRVNARLVVFRVF
ncbi:hypothetical protein COD67_23900 [Bacillus cereus]|nr:hypothetical protein COI89_19290 [Bacillus cereus]PGU61441.1 hypothetical protein COD67_23900 [Bacillus cereus]